MASLEKYTDNAVLFELRHNTRENPRPPKNRDIDPSRTRENYSLLPEARGGAEPDQGRAARAAKDYYNRRLKEIYRYNRDDVKTLCQWVVTAPKDLPAEQQKEFFRETYNFLNSLYGEKNCIQAIVHYDEGVKDSTGKIVAGEPHLHYAFIPVVENKKYLVPGKNGTITKKNQYAEKVCADQLINKKHLQQFHPKYQAWLEDHEIHATVHSGVTGGKNKTVDQLKAEALAQQHHRDKEKIKELESALSSATEKILELEKELEQTREKVQDRDAGWGRVTGWGKEVEHEWEKTY